MIMKGSLEIMLPFLLTVWFLSFKIIVISTADEMQSEDGISKGDWQQQYQHCKWRCIRTSVLYSPAFFCYCFQLLHITNTHFFVCLFGHREVTRVFLMYLHWFCLKLLNMVLRGHSLLCAFDRQRKIISKWEIRCFRGLAF